MPLITLNQLEIRPVDMPQNLCATMIDNKSDADFLVHFKEAGKKLNIGVLAYTTRTLPAPGNPAKVRKATLRADRIKPLKNFGHHAIERYFIGNRPLSIYADFRTLRTFLNWGDKNSAAEALSSPKSYHKALISYSYVLHNSVQKGRKPNSLITQLNYLERLGSILFEDSSYNFRIGVKHLSFESESVESTTVPEESALMEATTLISDIFVNIYDFLINNRALPHTFQAGKEKIWLMPTRPVLLSEGRILSNQSFGLKSNLWNAVRSETARLAMSGSKDLGEFIRSTITTLMEDKDKDKEKQDQNQYRYELARLAHDCFLFQFVLVTSANEAPISDIPWTEESAIITAGQNFRSIKYRAGKKDVTIDFTSKFSKAFRSYIDIRNILLNGKEHKFLFGNFNNKKPHKKLRFNLLSHLRKRISITIDPLIEIAGYKQLRAYGTAFHTQNSSLLISAERAQHDQRTALRSYTTGNPAINAKEVTAFFSGLGQQVEVFMEKGLVKSTTAGGCAGNLIDAKNLDIDTGVSPDCKDFLGCLFCEHYLIHITDGDIRKLLSIVYILEQRRATQLNPEEFEQKQEKILNRATKILEKIRAHNAQAYDLVKSIETDVFEEENLDAYWLRKLNMMVEIGVLQ